MNLSSKVVLVGPMGVGKTTVGRKLANALGLRFLDTDQLFVAEHGDISRFFAQHGETEFRRIEGQILKTALESADVIATGGGVVLSEQNRLALATSTVVYLKTDGTHIKRRLSQGNRPLLSNSLDDWSTIYEQRKPLYEQVATISVDCSGQPIKATVDEIRRELAL